MEEKVIVVRKVIVVKNQRRRVETKEKVIQDQVVMMKKVETNEKKRQKKKKKKKKKKKEEEKEVVVVRKRVVAKGGSKAKPGTPKARSQQMTPLHRSPEGIRTRRCRRVLTIMSPLRYGMRVRRAVEVVMAWKALPPGVGDTTSVLKMADEVLNHLIVVGSSVTSGSTTSAATPSQP
ncbi:hypothetical protein Scep_027448 [Stephania cephalantha]|uniref:Uncharacterized protein n=1 Tax=Stephania cephalantha TaxID=152367 RepID=A0AAP0HL36_9MAGN